MPAQTQMTVTLYNELTAKLRQLGFKILPMCARTNDNGRWNCNDNITIVVTELGIYARDERTDEPETLAILEKLCPKGRGEFATLALCELMEPETGQTEDCV